MRCIRLTLTMAAALLVSCSPKPSSVTRASATEFFFTAALPRTPAPSSALAPVPATPTPTAQPVEGTTSAELNVRAEPTSASAVLGTIGPFTKVQIQARDPAGNWYEIEFAGGKDGFGWVSSQYVDVKDKNAIPEWSDGAGSEASGVIAEQINVRAGPGTDYETLAILQAKDDVALTGKDPGGLWLQIQFAAGPDGKGWVAAGYVQANQSVLDQLPIVGQEGAVPGTETPASSRPIMTPTPMEAPNDQDSADAPGADVLLSASGTSSFLYSSDVSAPLGDAADWIRFIPFGSKVSASLVCTGNAKLSAEIRQISTSEIIQAQLRCGETEDLTLTAGQAYLLKLSPIGNAEKNQYVRYTLRIVGAP